MQLRHECTCGAVFHGIISWLHSSEDMLIRYDQFVERHRECTLMALGTHPSQQAIGVSDISVAQNLSNKFSPEHPKFDKVDWRGDIRNGDTHLGYWDWVAYNIESANNDTN